MIEFVQRNRIVVSRAFALAFFAIVLVSRSGQEATLVAPLMFLAGLVLVGVATVGRLWCSLYVSGYKDSELVTVGPYSVTRNPLYFFSFLGFAGVGLATETLTLALALIAFFALVYPFIILREEAYLRARHGAEFEAYCARVPRFLPRPSGYSEPASWLVNTRLFRRTMTDVVWFVWLCALIELVEALHEYGVVEPWFTLP
jgi:protein-S-isoprenylcysteine O-methyltransferase Ste14